VASAVSIWESAIRSPPSPEIGAVGRKLDHARVVGMHQRVVPQHHEDMAARIDGDVGDKACVPRPGAEGRSTR